MSLLSDNPFKLYYLGFLNEEVEETFRMLVLGRNLSLIVVVDYVYRKHFSTCI